nr:hypothetical protein [Adhaeribacter aquaticus]
MKLSIQELEKENLLSILGEANLKFQQNIPAINQSASQFIRFTEELIYLNPTHV